MSLLCDNLAVGIVAASLSAVAWCYGGLMGNRLETLVPWLFVLLTEAALFFPQHHEWETQYEARLRAWDSMKRDPFVWIALGFLAVLVFPLLNHGLCPTCDAARIASGFDPKPAFAYLPTCFNRTDHYHVLLWFMMALPATIVVRHCLVSKGRRRVLEMVVWNGMALAILGFVQHAVNAPGPLWTELGKAAANAKPSYFFSTFGYPNAAGDYFCTLFALAMALWRDHFERFTIEFAEKDISRSAPKRPRMFWRKHYFLIPAVILFFAAVNTMSRASIVSVTTVAFVCFVHTLVSFLSRMKRAKRVIVGAWSFIVFCLVVYFAVNCMPKSLRKEVDSLGSYEMLNRVTGKGDFHQRVAFAIWSDYKLFGSGGWGYAHLCLPTMLPEEKRKLYGSGTANVHNDYLQFLCEHGALGFGALVAMAVLLIWPVASQWSKMAKALRFSQSKMKPPKPMALFVLPAPVLFIMLSALMTCIHAFGDCPFRSLAVLSLFYVSLAAMPGFMPRQHKQIG